MQMHVKCRYVFHPLGVALVLMLAPAAMADNWQIYMTVDNQFDVYFGTPTTTNYYAGGGSSWPTEYSFTALGRLPTDYLYVATASDHNVAQGFIGNFTNTTTSASIATGNVVWEVFPAGAYAATNPYWPSPWPASLMPTQTEVDAAISYATANNLWVAPSTAPGYDNDPSTSTSPYSNPWGIVYPNIPASANWIWYDSGKDTTNINYPSPLEGFNHDEFLVFRVAGIVPEPTTVMMLSVGGLVLLRRPRRRQPAAAYATQGTTSF
jgi:hypothetical protein